jgi:hypothetical protein
VSSYGKSIYGLDTYGLAARVEFHVSPFTATPVDYTTVVLDWKAPAGTWDTLRLLRNRYGWSVNENDGEILLSQSSITTSFADKAVVGGQWLYYTIFIQANGRWSRAGTVSCLMPQDHGYTDMLYSLIPEHYKVDVKPGNAITDDSNTVNPYLKPFLSTFGFGFDIVKSYYDSNRYTNAAMRTRFENIQRLAEQFGIQYEASAPAHLFRQRVRDAATLGRQKGTLEQIQSVISQTTGYDVDLRIGYNLMLSDDQADFDHPTYPQWDAGVNYASGDRVEFGAYLYQAGSKGAYGSSQAPTGTATSNTYWTVVQYGTDSSLVDENGHVAGWEEISFTTGITPGTGGVLVGIGVQNPTNPDDKAGNALWVRNTNSGGAAATMGVRSVGRLSGQTAMDPKQPILYGVPLPYTWQAWDEEAYYQTGDTVLYHGRIHQALTSSINVAPPSTSTANAQWTPLGYDERVQTCLSGYAQAYSGEQVAVYPFVEYYDEHGSLITALYSDQVPAYNVHDAFTDWSKWSAGHTTGLGGLTWSVKAGAWVTSGYAGGAAYPDGTARALATLTGHADGTVAVTFATKPDTGRTQGLVFRYQDNSNYWRATRTGLQRIASGAVASTSTYSSSFADGDRLTVSYSGSNIAVKKNGTQVLTITDSNLSTATGVGLVVE